MARDRPTVCKQELLKAFARYVSISSNFLLFFVLNVQIKISISFFTYLVCVGNAKITSHAWYLSFTA